MRYRMLAAALLCSSPALACDCVTLIPGGPHFATDLERISAFYPVASEGGIRIDRRDGSFRFFPSHEVRGRGQSSYVLDQISDCSLSFEDLRAIVGKPVFLILAGGPEKYEVGRCINLLGGAAEDALREQFTRRCATH